MAAFVRERQADLASGVPRQHLGTFSERLLIPLIHFLLLGFLPIHAMRRSRWKAFATGCGQLFIARAEAYDACGGHSRIRTTLHDGLKLPKLFRAAGWRTDLFDATDVASCRMYHTNAGVWRGLAKNATEGLGAPAVIVPMTGLLFAGQVLPWVLLAVAPSWRTAAVATLTLLPRLIATWKFRQSWRGALLHPLGVLGLLGIQWWAVVRSWRGQPANWKGRDYRQLAEAKL
jgi:hypothetical protein